VIWIVALFLLFTSSGHCLQPITKEHDNQEKTDLEFDNLYRNAQDQQFTVVNSSLAMTDMKDGQAVIYTTGTVTPIFQIRVGTSVYVIRTEFYK
jgi:hypothetical protein